MSEQLLIRQRRRELLITVSYSIFSVLMIAVTAIEHWPVLYIPIIAGELAFVWWSYANAFRSYKIRAFIVTGMTCLNIFLYGIQGENFEVLIPTICVQMVLLSLYEISHVMSIAILQTLLLFLYHVLVKGTFEIPESSLERNRMILQILSLIILTLLCIYRMRHHEQEEEDFSELEKKVDMEQKIKDDFVANTSHELRTPINTISGMSEILLQQNLPDDIHSSVLDIQMTSVELHSIVTDILDYAALESDTMDLAPRSYSITSTINDVMNMTVFENKDKQLEIIFDCDPNIPRLLEGDEHQLRRVLNNLISNAIKFTNEGGVTVQVSYRPEKYGINLVVSVKDTGVGISLEDQEMIMRGFYQADSDRNRRSVGMGLGLTISTALIRKMGGFLTVKSQPGKGSEFSFAIPQKVLDDQPCISLLHPGTIKLIWYYKPQSDMPSVRDSFVEHIKHFSDYFGIISHQANSLEECKRRVTQGQGIQLVLGRNEYLEDKEYFDALSETTPIILVAEHNDSLTVADNIHVLYKPYNAMMLAEIFNGRDVTVPRHKNEKKKFVAPDAKILVVDDNLMNLKVVEGMLRKYRIKIVGASSGEEALSLIESKDFDFVFMDHMMPGMDGVECFHHIREKAGPYYERVPIIALTANAIAGSREMFLAEGFNDFVAKPIDSALMNDVLRRYIPQEKQLSEEAIEKAAAEESKEEAKENKQEKKTRKSKDRKSGKSSAKGAGPADPFAKSSGIDKETALMYCGSLEDFKELAEVYCKTGETYEKDLEQAFKDMDLKKYAITAHTIKSTSKTLGAIALSNLALTQEIASKEEKEDLVRDNHEDFCREYSKILELLRAYLKEDDKEDAPEEAPAKEPSADFDWNSLKADLLESLEAFEEGSFEEKLERAKGQTVDGKPVEELLAGVLELANNFEFDKAIAELNDIGGKA